MTRKIFVLALALFICLAGAIKTEYTYAQTYVQVTFDVSGLPNDIQEPICTVDSIDLFVNDFPYTFNWLVGSTHMFEWHSPVYSSTAQYVWVNTTGLSNEQQDAIIVPESGGYVNATYQENVVQVTFTSNLAGMTTTPIFLVDNIDLCGQDLPYTFSWRPNSVHTILTYENVTVLSTNTQYVLQQVFGLVTSTTQVIIANETGTVTANYININEAWADTQVCQVSSTTATIYPHQSKTIIAAGRFWVFYAESGELRYRSALPGDAWEAPTTISFPVTLESSFSANDFAVWLDEYGKLHIAAYVDGPGSDDRIIYRMGTPQSDGTIDWAAGWQTVDDYRITGFIDICVDTSGHAYILYRTDSGASGNIHLVKNGLTNGTWSQAWKKNYLVSAYYDGIIRPLSQGRLLDVFYYSYESTYYLKYRLHNVGDDTAYTISSSATQIITDNHAWDLVTYENEAYLAYLQYNSSNIYVHHFVYEQGWSAVETVTETATQCSYPVTFIVNGTLFVAYPEGTQITIVKRVNATNYTFSFSYDAENEIYGASMNAFERKKGDKMCIAYIVQTEETRYLHLLYQPVISEEEEEAPGIYIVNWAWVIALVGLGLFIISPYMLVKHIREKSFEGSINWFLLAVIGFFLFISGLLAA